MLFSGAAAYRPCYKDNLVGHMKYLKTLTGLFWVAFTLSPTETYSFQAAAIHNSKGKANVSDQEESVGPMDVSEWTGNHYQQALDKLLPMTPPFIRGRGTLGTLYNEWYVNFRLVDTEWIGPTEGGFQLAKLESGSYVASVTVLEETPLLLQLEAIRRRYRDLNNGKEPTLDEALAHIRKKSGVVSTNSCETLGPVISKVETIRISPVPPYAGLPPPHSWPNFEYKAVSGENEHHSNFLFPSDEPLTNWFRDAVGEMLSCLDNDK